MEFIKEVIENLVKLFSLVKENSISSILFVVGILLFIFAGFLIYKVIKLEPEKTPFWFLFLIFAILTGGVFFHQVA